MKSKYSLFCTGCGICKKMFEDGVVRENNRFLCYQPITKEAKSFCKKVCPAFNKSYDSDGDIWGKRLLSFFTYSSNEIIRKKSSSGGTISEIAIFLLKHKIVDGIIQVKQNSTYSLELTVSYDVDEIVKNSGSKYIDSSYLFRIVDLIKTDKKYCFIGKPCDVITLKRFAIFNSSIRDNIVLYISFFCAGSPSVDANKRLVESLGCKESDCESIAYRGNGWPGETIVKDKKGNIYKTSYDNSWGHYLGRDIRTVCRFCSDGIGEMADISCADGWFVNNGKPDFSERPGRNITFVRTNTGKNIIDLMRNDGSLIFEQIEDEYNYLRTIQEYQFVRRATLSSTILALKICLMHSPSYNKKVLKGYSKNLNFNAKFRRFAGTFKRILKGKI